MSVKDKSLAHALKILDALNCQYKVIASDGNEYGQLQIAPLRKRKPSNKYKWGERSAYVRPHLKSLAIGDVAVIPPAHFGLTDLQSTVTSVAHQLWGPSSYSSSITGGSVELLRIA